ncbi:MAG: glycosyltransferase family 2 protein [Candidatus Aminicenantes bacterium]|nr:glycosyltransferase family 2 protein [Candidatus Aminicenantes bacterium]
MRLTVCLVNFNSGPLLARCLDSLEPASSGLEYEVLVVDNGSRDGSAAAAEGRARTRLLRNGFNAGFAAANNLAFREARGRDFMLLNADTEVLPGALEALVRFAEAHPRAGLIAARLLNFDGTPQKGFNVRRFPTFSALTSQVLLLDEIWPGNPWTRAAGALDMDDERPQRVEQPAASALFFRRETWSEVGGFDPDFANWFNDVDLCRRIAAAGWEIWYCPEARVLHHGGKGAVSRTHADVMKEYYRSERAYILKHHGLWAYLAVSLAVTGGMALRLAASAGRRRVLGSTYRLNDRTEVSGYRAAVRAVIADTATGLIVGAARRNSLAAGIPGVKR